MTPFFQDSGGRGLYSKSDRCSGTSWQFLAIRTGIVNRGNHVGQCGILNPDAMGIHLPLMTRCAKAQLHWAHDDTPA